MEDPHGRPGSSAVVSLVGCQIDKLGAVTSQNLVLRAKADAVGLDLGGSYLPGDFAARAVRLQLLRVPLARALQHVILVDLNEMLQLVPPGNGGMEIIFGLRNRGRDGRQLDSLSHLLFENLLLGLLLLVSASSGGRAPARKLARLQNGVIADRLHVDRVLVERASRLLHEHGRTAQRSEEGRGGKEGWGGGGWAGCRQGGGGETGCVVYGGGWER